MANISKAGTNLKITSTGTQNDTLVLTDLVGKNPDVPYELLIEVLSGSFQFNVGGECTADNDTLTDGMKVIVKVGVGFGVLNYKAGATSQTFRVSYV